VVTTASLLANIMTIAPDKLFAQPDTALFLRYLKLDRVEDLGNTLDGDIDLSQLGAEWVLFYADSDEEAEEAFLCAYRLAGRMGFQQNYS
jgi:hypothetical protein